MKNVCCVCVCRVKGTLRTSDVQEVREAGGSGGSADSERQPEAGRDEVREASAGGSEQAGAQDVAGTHTHTPTRTHVHTRTKFEIRSKTTKFIQSH